MTRAEKFEEVFGIKVDSTMKCGFFDCSDIEQCSQCPIFKSGETSEYVKEWWEAEYVDGQ